jgi:hypothetical protein
MLEAYGVIDGFTIDREVVRAVRGSEDSRVEDKV